VALALVASDLELLPFVLVMGAAWILVATAERMIAGPGLALPPFRHTGAEQRAEPQPTRPERHREPEPRPVAQPAVEQEPVEEEPAADAEAKPEPEIEPRPVLEALPDHEPEPEPEPQPEPEEPEPEHEAVVELPRTAQRRAGGWNLWDLEQRAQERAGDDPLRDEEWRALFVSLRDFARPDGTLPPEFDQLVEEAFADVISRRA
jgi:hypothetical protein